MLMMQWEVDLVWTHERMGRLLLLMSYWALASVGEKAKKNYCRLYSHYGHCNHDTTTNV